MNCHGCENGRYQCPGLGTLACPMLPPDNGADAYDDPEPYPSSDADW